MSVRLPDWFHEMREEIRTLEQQRDRYAGLLQLAASELRSEGRPATADVIEAALMRDTRPTWSGE